MGGWAREHRKHRHSISYVLVILGLKSQVSKMKLRPGLVSGTLHVISLTCVMANSQGITIKEINGGPSWKRIQTRKEEATQKMQWMVRGKPNTEGISQSFSDMGIFMQRFSTPPHKVPSGAQNTPREYFNMYICLLHSLKTAISWSSPPVLSSINVTDYLVLDNFLKFQIHDLWTQISVFLSLKWDPKFPMNFKIKGKQVTLLTEKVFIKFNSPVLIACLWCP